MNAKYNYTSFQIFKKNTQKGKAFSGLGRSLPCAESTTTECGVNYQLFAVMY